MDFKRQRRNRAPLGLAWNVFRAVQFLASLHATPESLQVHGMTPKPEARKLVAG